jgi:hypothetical protein
MRIAGLDNGEFRHLTPCVAAFVVKPELRGSGIGTRMLALLEAKARMPGIDELYPWTEDQTAFYQRRVTGSMRALVLGLRVLTCSPKRSISCACCLDVGSGDLRIGRALTIGRRAVAARSRQAAFNNESTRSGDQSWQRIFIFICAAFMASSVCASSSCCLACAHSSASLLCSVLYCCGTLA